MTMNRPGKLDTTISWKKAFRFVIRTFKRVPRGFGDHSQGGIIFSNDRLKAVVHGR